MDGTGYRDMPTGMPNATGELGTFNKVATRLSWWKMLATTGHSVATFTSIPVAASNHWSKAPSLGRTVVLVATPARVSESTAFNTINCTPTERRRSVEKIQIRAYRHYVKQGLEVSLDPFKHELRQWVFGSEDFLRQMLLLAEGADEKKYRVTSRRLKSVSAQEVVEATAKVYGVKASDYTKFRCSAAGRDTAAWLCRQWTGTSLEGLSVFFGVEGTGSVSSLVRRAEQRRQRSKDWTTRHVKVEHVLSLNTQHQASPLEKPPQPRSRAETPTAR